jgi:integrase
MPIFKRKYKSGEVVWSYVFSAPGATREDQRQITKSGFATKKEAQDAEAARRIEEQRKYELERSGAVHAGIALPKSLGMLLDEHLAQHGEDLAPKTLERYREYTASLTSELLAMPIAEIKPLQFHNEWKRLLREGGIDRRTKQPRGLAPVTVRCIGRLVSSAYKTAIEWELVPGNPVAASKLPKVPKREGVALTTVQQDLLIAAATSPWCLPMILEMDAATGVRRGELLALRWSDIQEGRAVIGRSLSQTKALGLQFKQTKTNLVRVLALPGSILVSLDTHRERQNQFRQQYGQDYRADLDLIFTKPDGSPLEPDTVSNAVWELFRRLKIPKPKGASLHLFRHSHGSHMLAEGVPLIDVSKRLGHSSVRTTADIYAHQLEGQDAEAIRKWEEFQRKSREAAGERVQVQ